MDTHLGLSFFKSRFFVRGGFRFNFFSSFWPLESNEGYARFPLFFVLEISAFGNFDENLWSFMHNLLDEMNAAKMFVLLMFVNFWEGDCFYCKTSEIKECSKHVFTPNFSISIIVSESGFLTNFDVFFKDFCLEFDWTIDWLAEWLLDWIDWLLNDWLIDWLFDWRFCFKVGHLGKIFHLELV